MPTENNLQYDVTAVTHPNWLNLARDLSALNSRGYGATDKKGNLLTYVVDFEFLTNSASQEQIHIYTAPSTWRLKSAFKKFHALREFMFRESGISKSERGRYAKIMRPYFDPLHQAKPQYTLSPQGISYTADGESTTWTINSEAAIAGGDWTYSQLVVETNPDTPDTALETDTFSMHIVGANVNNTTGTGGSDQNWDSVGMIASFNADRAEPSAEPAKPVDVKQNPLALLRGRSESSAETTAIAATEALDGPPYDTDAQGDSINPVLGGYLETTGTGAQITRAYGVRIPAGLCLIEASGTCEFRCVVRRIEMA